MVGFITAISICGLSLGVAILVTVLSVINGFDRELQQRILGLVPHASIASARHEPLLSLSGWEDYRERIEEHPQVVATAPLLELQGMLLSQGRSKGVLVNGIDPEREAEISVIGRFFSEGSLHSLESGSYRILIGASLAEQLGVGLGDSVTLATPQVFITPLGEFPRNRKFVVSGIFKVGSLLDSNLAMIHLEDAQRLYRMGDKINGLRLRLDNLFSVDELGFELLQDMPEEFLIRNWIMDYGTIYENIQLSKKLVGLLLFLLVAVAAFNVVVSLVMVVRDKQGDIAILRTMGTSAGSIRRIFLVQGLVIGFFGTGIGLILGIFFSLTVSDFVAWLEGVLNIQFLSAEIYPVNYLPSQLQAVDILLVGAMSFLLCLLATLYPSQVASRVRPAEALRFE